MLARIQSWRMAEGRGSSTSVELTPRRREGGRMPGIRAAEVFSSWRGWGAQNAPKERQGVSVLLRYKAQHESWGEQEKKC